MKTRDEEGTKRLHQTMVDLKALAAREDGSLSRRLAETVFGYHGGEVDIARDEALQ